MRPLISANHLEMWANRREAESDFPLLLRHLVRATLPLGDLSLCNFPAEEGVRKPGYDGVVRARSGNEWVPKGLSVWECGVGNKPGDKATREYRKRNLNPSPYSKKGTTFIFAAPRRWIGKQQWINKRRGKHEWADVRVYDADELVQWLECAPDVAMYFAQHLVKPAIHVEAERRLTFSNWKKKRVGANQEVSPLETDWLKTISDDICAHAADRPRHYLIVGDIASGKSSLAQWVGERFIEWFSKESELPALIAEHRVLILPLSPNFQLERDWTVSKTRDEFFKALRSGISKPGLLIIEDAHEGEGVPGVLWTPDDIDLSDYSLLVTTRIGGKEAVKGELQKLSKGKHEVTERETDPESVAKSMIEERIAQVISNAVPKNGRFREEFLRVFRAAGKDLFVLRAMLDAWEDPSQLVGVQLAYDIVIKRLSTLAREAIDSCGRGQQEVVQFALAILWMMDGLEFETPSEFLQYILGIQVDDAVLDVLVNADELIHDKRGRLRGRRHPAWGRLAIRAIEKHELGTSLTIKLREEISRKYPGLDCNALRDFGVLDYLILFLLLKKAVERWKLAFNCSGTFLSEHFMKAGLKYLNLSSFEHPADRAEAILDIAMNARRCNLGDLRSWPELLDRADSWFREALDILRREYGENLQRAPKRGYILYEAGYLRYLHGDYLKAADLFQESKEADHAAGGSRLPYAAQSANMESLCLGYAEKFGESEEVSCWALETLEKAQSTVEDPVKYRFRANIWSGLIQVALVRGDIEKAEGLMEKYEADALHFHGGVDYTGDIYRARIALYRRNAPLAEELVLPVIRSEESMKSVETAITAYRVLGDALLMKGDVSGSRSCYKQIVPVGYAGGLKYTDFALAQSRLAGLEAGQSIEDLLRGSTLW